MTPFEQFTQDFQGKKVLIFGLGLQGRGVGDAKLFAEIGCNVMVTDLKTEDQLHTSLQELEQYSITYRLGSHHQDDIEWADVIIRNASVPWKHPLLEKARELGKPLYMDTQLFVHYARQQLPIIGITGTRGKTTTTTMIYQILDAAYPGNVLLGGNIPGIATLSFLKKLEATPTAYTHVVLELSSWQLQAFGCHQTSPHYAVITNIYPDHLDKGESMDEYIADKTQIFTHQRSDDWVFLNQDNEITRQFEADVVSQLIWFRGADISDDIQLKVRGAHNYQNAAAAYQVTKQIGIPDATIQAVLENFTGVPYRLETIRVHQDIEYINDTTSTTPIAAVTALEAVEKPIYLIVGGTDKKLPVEQLVTAINRKVVKVALLQGNGTDRIKDQLDASKVIGEFDNLAQAVHTLQAAVQPGSVLLFSPGFTSFGMFNNEFHRGDEFNRIVQQL